MPAAARGLLCSAHTKGGPGNIEKKAGVVAGLILTLTCLGASGAAAQIPDEFKNLQVLPKDIAQRDLINQMRGFATGLGVRCHHCHVGEPGPSLEGYDFASDEKPAKKTARVMLQMVAEINGKLLPQIGKEKAELLQVSCATCHHGQARPQTLEAVLTETFEKDGLEAATAKYRELREKHYGSYTFDFSEWRLLMSETIHPCMNGHRVFAEEAVSALAGKRVPLPPVAPYRPTDH